MAATTAPWVLSLNVDTRPQRNFVAQLVARGEIALGFQQLSELIHLEGIAVVGPMPAAIAIDTVFSAGLCTSSTQPDAVRALRNPLTSPLTADAKRRQGMTPA